MARLVATLLLVTVLVGCSEATHTATPPPAPTGTAVTPRQPTTLNVIALPTPQPPSPVATPLPTSVATPDAPPSVSVATAGSRGAVPRFWAPQRDVQSTAGEFAVKSLLVTASHIHLSYVMHTALPGPPLIGLSVSPGTCPNATAQAPNTSIIVADFGRLNDVEVGVVTFPWTDQPGQVFTLAITPPGFAAAVWQMPVLGQNAPAPNVGSESAPSYDPTAMDAFPEILTVEGTVIETLTPGLPGRYTGRFNGYFALEAADAVRHYLPQVFFVIETDGTVRQITSDAFAAIGGLTSGSYGTVGPIVLPSPYPLTATIPSRATSMIMIHPQTMCG